MPSFRGRFSHTLDKKGRVSIPVRYRDILRTDYDEQLMLYPEKGCLRVYPLREWEKMEGDLKGFSSFNDDVEEFKRKLSAVQECTVDAQGRILITPELRSAAGLADKVMFVGMIEFFEIWNRDAFMGRYPPTEEEPSDIRARISRLSERKGI